MELDRYTKKKIPRRRKKSLNMIRSLDLLKRALQRLPPRELQMLYAVKVLRVEQDELTSLYSVRQSNISYRLDRAEYRIQLHAEIANICSETQLRKALYDVGLNESAVRAVLGVVKTSSQSATAQALQVTQGSVRHIFSTAITKLSEPENDDVENREESLRLLRLIEMNYNQLRSIKSQRRWAWKVRGGNYPTPQE